MKLGVVVDHLIVDFIGKNQDIVLLGNGDDRFQRFLRIDRTGRVVRIDHDHRARAWRNKGFELLQIRFEAVFRAAGIVLDDTSVQRRCCGPERIVRAGDQYLVAGIDECAQ